MEQLYVMIDKEVEFINPFFDVRRKNLLENETFKPLLDVPDSSDLYDSPFVQTDTRSKQNIMDFLTILDIFIEINDCIPQTLQQILAWSESNSILLNKIFMYAKLKSLSSFLDMLETVSSKITFSSHLNLNALQHAKNALYTSTQKYFVDIAYMPADLKTKYMNLQILLLFWSSSFIDYFEFYSKNPDNLSNKKLTKFIDMLNDFVPKSKNLILKEIGLENVMYELFWTNFFRSLSKTLLYSVFPQISVIPNPESIIGIIAGFALLDRDLVRVNLGKLLGGTNSKVVNGLFGVIINNSTLEKEINALWKKVKIKGDLTLNLLKIMANYKKQNVFNPCMRIWEQYWSSPKLVSGLVSIFKNDLTNIRVFSDYLGVDNKMILLALAWASRRSDLLEGNYEKLAKILEIDSESAVRILIEIHWGYKSWVKKWTQETDLFTTIDKETTKNIFMLNRIGMKMRANHNQFDIPNSISLSLKPILLNICTSIGLNPNRNINMKTVNEIRKTLSNHLSDIMMGVWGDLKAEEFIKSIIDRVRISNDKLNKIWSNFPNKTTQILQMSFNKVYTSAVSEIKKINNQINKNMIENKHIFFDLNISSRSEAGSNRSINAISETMSERHEEDKYSEVPKLDERVIKDENEVIGMLNDINKKAYYKVGCTVNISGNKLIYQNYKRWLTCKSSVKVDVKVCVPCAEFWHAGHNLLDYSGRYSKAACSWGTHLYPTLKINSNKNPLYDIYIGNLPTNCWSLLKSNWKYLKIRNLMFKLEPNEESEYKENDKENINKSGEHQSVSDESSDDSSSESSNESEASLLDNKEFIEYAEKSVEELIAIRNSINIRKQKK